MNRRYTTSPAAPDPDAPGTWQCAINLNGTPHYRVLACFNPEAAEAEAKRLVHLLKTCHVDENGVKGVFRPSDGS